MKYRHIVFDIDGTLIDTEYAVLHSLQDTLRAISGKEIPVSELTFALGITGKDALEILGIKDLSRAQGLWDTYWRGYADTVRVFDGIIELLDHLQRLGCRMGIVTSQTREEFRQNFCPFGIRPYFKTIVRAEDTREHKPSAAPLFKYLETAELETPAIFAISDIFMPHPPCTHIIRFFYYTIYHENPYFAIVIIFSHHYDYCIVMFQLL